MLLLLLVASLTTTTTPCWGFVLRPPPPRFSMVSFAEDAIGAWVGSADLEVGTKVMVNDVNDGISLSAIFWTTVEELLREAKNEASQAVLVFSRGESPLAAWVDYVASLDIRGLEISCRDDAPCPTLLARVEPEMASDLLEIDASGSVPTMQRWVQDVIVDTKVCPFTASPTVAGSGLADVQPGAIGYPTCAAVGSSDAALVVLMSTFWSTAVDLLNAPPEDLSTLLLCAPHFAPRDHDAFARMTACLVKNLKLVQADHLLSLVFFHPLYDRSRIHPPDAMTHGHLPPEPWLPSYLRLAHSEEEIANLTKDQLKRANYQRRAPFTVINVLRSDQVEKAETVVPWELIEPEPGRRVRVSGARVYAQNTWRLATKSQQRTDPDTGHLYLAG
ncbi:hypothetical protein CTAYLR_000953 [Chrysophaeum taylorii]|uniref:Uncharacterized protein n=1 Tax=Chrysophaeum taylorii TaxID=2483200 RepID=A0AAD7XMP5_9STRA|nr:hypothetical protein CTAYLR_000953 [Chrysophaeum taylorii]